MRLGLAATSCGWTFVLVVIVVYDSCQGVDGITAGYYWKDVQRAQPPAVQFYQGLTNTPWPMGRQAPLGPTH
ncbi:hypothetical protein PR202_gb12885 [Eleusine coracana subsp. coracana]|uniref:Secreted protein n=1 Tax=Eleusine coracana subsp. coracana TaxID=191504 RepID=A0AAV5EQR4_ELECO|nr:hypothetical protein PR202_gb12885 [Eleusine coracana subsp. coracana]